jgi:hypothetical protein
MSVFLVAASETKLILNPTIYRLNVPYAHLGGI